MTQLKDMPEEDTVEIFKAWLNDEPIINRGGWSASAEIESVV